MSIWTDRFFLPGRKALVTGASKGSGAGICEVFAHAGADIVAVARDEGPAEVGRAVEGQGRRCLTIHPELAGAGTVNLAEAALFLTWDTSAMISGDLPMAEGGITSV